MRLKQIFILAKSVCIENIRNKSIIVLMGVGIGLFFLSHILASMAIGESAIIILNFGFWIIGMWGLIIALFFGVNIIKQEILNKTIYLILSRPVSRLVFILGKFLGILILMLLLFFILSAIFMLQMVLIGKTITPVFLIALGFVYLEWIVLASFSILFATFTSPVLHIFFLSAVYFLGHWSKYLYIYSEHVDPLFLKKTLVFLYHGFPNLETLNYRGAALYGESVDFFLLIKSFGLAGLWSLSIVSISMIIFYNRKVL